MTTYTVTLSNVGMQGPAGANWRGAWADATDFVVNDVVRDGGDTHICILGHTSATADRPSNGANAATYWAVFAAGGESAYQTWLDEGNTGTEQDFLDDISAGAITATAANVTAAQAAQTAAETAETNAAASATAAAASETAAETAQTAAETAQAAAATSATNAATSETNAATSAATASTAATNAGTSETNAAASAAAAATSETNAATSETNAAASESAAASSATAAATSETNAAASETAAATSETNAATSATAAATSATNAAASATAAEGYLDTFEGSYIGQYADDAAANASGKTIAAGVFYYKTTATTGLRIYNGTAWDDAVLDVTNSGGALLVTNNLSDLGDTGTARTNLGLGTSAVLNVASTGDAAVGEVVKGNDTRLTDSRDPNAHVHATTDITSGTFADARIAESNVTQHQAALSLTEAQISDLGAYLTTVAIADISDWPAAVSAIEVGYLDGVTSAIQTQIDGKQAILSEGAFANGDKTKLDGIEAGATADQTGAEIKTAYEAEADTNAFTDALLSKLTGIEAGADVTDTANVTAAGALMDSEVTNLAAVKAFDPADYATAAQGATADTAAQPDDVETADISAQTGTTYTLVIGDRGQVVTMNNANANTVTIPTNASVAFAVGSVVTVIQIGAGATTITGATGVTVNGSSGGSVAISAQYQGVSLLKVATDTWIASGAI